MLTLGSATSGYDATGSTRIDAMPARITEIVITQANTGRLAKNRASTSVVLGRWVAGCGLRLGGLGAGLDLGRTHRHAGPHLVEALDDQALAGGQIRRTKIPAAYFCSYSFLINPLLSSSL